MFKVKENYTMHGTVNGVTSAEGVQAILDKISEVDVYGNIDSSKIILDIGSGNGSALNEFKTRSGVTRAIGVEFLENRYDESVANYPDCEFHLAAIQEKLDLVSEADIIFTNDICFPEDVFWSYYDSIKVGAAIVYNKITHTTKLIHHYDYARNVDFNKLHIDANNMTSEFHIIIKK